MWYFTTYYLQDNRKGALLFGTVATIILAIVFNIGVEQIIM